MAFAGRTTSAGRGRGRARNLAALISTPGENGLAAAKYIPLNSQATNNVVDPFNLVEESLELCLRQATQENLQSCLSKTNDFATGDERIRKLVSSVFEKCLADRNMATNAGQVAAILSGSEKMGSTFRNIFLKKFQETYNNREEEKKTKFERYLSFSIFLCSVYNHLRTNDGQVINVLAKPVYKILGELLDGSEDVSQREKGMEIFRDNLLMVASVLEESDKSQMDELFRNVRNTIVNETSPKIKCILLETFEYYSNGKWTMVDETRAFYGKLMADVTV